MVSYSSAMSQVLAKIHPDANARKEAEKLARQVIDFETSMSAAIPDLADLYDVTVSRIHDSFTTMLYP
jgi:hypothetical protein